VRSRIAARKLWGVCGGRKYEPAWSATTEPSTALRRRRAGNRASTVSTLAKLWGKKHERFTATATSCWASRRSNLCRNDEVVASSTAMSSAATSAECVGSPRPSSAPLRNRRVGGGAANCASTSAKLWGWKRERCTAAATPCGAPRRSNLRRHDEVVASFDRHVIGGNLGRPRGPPRPSSAPLRSCRAGAVYGRRRLHRGKVVGRQHEPVTARFAGLRRVAALFCAKSSARWP
jgi:hypothetical protein